MINWKMINRNHTGNNWTCEPPILSCQRRIPVDYSNDDNSLSCIVKVVELKKYYEGITSNYLQINISPSSEAPPPLLL